MLNIDRFGFDIECPRCQFATRIQYRDARLRDVLICRGCKANLQLDDHMNECRKVRKQFNAAMRELEETISKLNTTLTIRL